MRRAPNDCRGPRLPRPLWWALACLLALPVLAGQPESRRLLALYDGQDVKSFQETPIYENLEVIADYLGLVVTYHDLRAGLPSHDEMAAYRGIVTWHTDAYVPDAAGYCRWLGEETRRGRYAVVLNILGAHFDEGTRAAALADVKALYRRWGLDYDMTWLVGLFTLEAEQVDQTMLGFERELRVGVGSYDQFTPLPKAGVDVLLGLRERTTGLPASAVIAVHPGGGYAFENYALYVDRETFRRQWVLNPFAFLQRALRWQDQPCPDPTTLNGCRIFFAHVDGVGAVNLVEGQTDVLAVELMQREILARTALPFSVGALVGEIEGADRFSWAGGRKRLQAAFRQIYALDNVEPASGGLTQTLDWGRGLTSLPWPELSGAPRSPLEERWRKDAKLPEAQVYLVPREVWERREVAESCRYIEQNLLHPGRRCRLFFWPGDAMPTASALALAERQDILTLNGGLSRFDQLVPSYTGLSPAARQLGPHVQVQAAACTEDLYTDGWTRNFGGLAQVRQTYERTGYPRRIKPVNLHCHSFMVGKIAATQALRAALDYCLKLDLAPLFASEYVRVLRNSRQVTLAREDDGWSWQGANECRTLRFDRCRRWPDLERSTGVLGFYRDTDLDCLYLHLDGSGSGRVRFTASQPQRPYLQRATGWVSDWRFGEQVLNFALDAKGRAWVDLGGLPPRQEVACTVGTTPIVMLTDGSGRGRLALPDERFHKRVPITVRCDLP